MLKKLIILLFIALPFSMVAQDKIAYINAEEVMYQMPEIRDLESKLATKREEIEKNLTAIQKEYEDKIAEFQNTPTEDITESILQDRQKQVQQLEERYQTYQENSYREFQELQQQLLQPIQQKFQKAVQEVGAEQGYTYVMNVTSLVYFSPSAVDASSFVKAKLGIN